MASFVNFVFTIFSPTFLTKNCKKKVLVHEENHFVNVIGEDRINMWTFRTSTSGASIQLTIFIRVLHVDRTLRSSSSHPLPGPSERGVKQYSSYEEGSLCESYWLGIASTSIWIKNNSMGRPKTLICQSNKKIYFFIANLNSIP